MTAKHKLTTILSYIAGISGESDLHKTLMQLANLGKDLASADRCTVWILDSEEQELWTTTAHGVEELRIPADSGLVGTSIRTGEVVHVKDAYQDERFNPAVDLSTGYQTKAILCVPFMNTDGEYIGAFQAINKLPPGDVFNEEDEEIVRLAASYAGNALDSKLLHEELLATQKELLETMGQIGESRSKETGHHVKRVALYSYRLAILAGMTEQEARLLMSASPMHDIGKVAIPDTLLLKPGKLTDEEFEKMKEHTDIGYHIFRHSKRELLQAAARIAYEHHEKWDGTGYPRGIKGEDIHIFGRITAIADVFDALGSDRIYKKAWPDHKILDHFRKQIGRHFDPRLMTIFLDNFDVFRKIRDEYSSA
ncbi:HD domain-containing phosphohydrolase [Salimicrobium halophilum]|uniref:GAF domain-containing protein n=1 Tax=Salimicrobium halophilum TaxID=86666 RepID=A0A1G8UW07_9BACI|nr:HD domain-containing phosphohydrolase [Salimicrobium halophilum]SDJ58046.1 GAF domain-containing protein [Salimicrobium halophilum]